MQYTVFILQEAEYDLEGILEYIVDSGRPESARNLIKRIRKACRSLSQMPERGRVLPELAVIGNQDYRQLIVQPYRIIYQVVESSVFVFAVLHGHRDLAEALKHRLVR